MMLSLNDLMKRYGAERINVAIQPLYIADGEEPIDPNRYVINAAINDPELWNTLSNDEQNVLYTAHLDTVFDTKELLNSLFDMNEPEGGFEIPD
ncbi:MAG: hypothetical protein EAZ70_07095 [Runella slithyformis]|nr:MAG: hypothetical protein EAY79_06455 [Runella slithyformis]TAE98763.1 MAG: hypothetical protein EAZ80_05965 [Runella slithyformis]TAF27566.1 MAG: hypothetical protein EAZ70_07095 [Runella slithyformis]TAF46080.1 MAG: hypothetical protein EAZ63_10055 [Runella slithyformis]TAF82262.1 MAG: hypothetical protein EAZ50_04495 [Runella slithyformis]